MKSKMILASNSPRRRELLAQVGLEFEVVTSNIEEHTDETEAYNVVKDLSRQKAMAVANEYDKAENEETIFIGSDTVVALDGVILGKPSSREDAFNMISMLKNRSHNVFTGVAVLCYKGDELLWEENFYEDTRVFVEDITDEGIYQYIDSGDPYDKAGSYGIQGLFAAYITGIEGDYNNVVGLPVGKLCKLLREHDLMI